MPKLGKDLGLQFLADRKMNNYNYLISSQANNFLRLAKKAQTRNLMGAALTAEQAFLLDRKIDDGRPNKGYILADNGYLANHQKAKIFDY